MRAALRLIFQACFAIGAALIFSRFPTSAFGLLAYCVISEAVEQREGNVNARGSNVR